MIDVSTFRATLPEFSNTTTFPDAMIQFQLNLAYASLNPRIWVDRLDAAALYYAAHYIALAGARAAQSLLAPATQMLGQATGLLSSKSVAGVSLGYDVGVGQTQDGGSFNLTTYGQQYLTLLGSIAIGGLQL